MSRSTFRSSLGFAFPFALLVTACGGSGKSDAPPSMAEVDALRHELFGAGILPLPDAPAVSDELFRLGQALFFDKILSGSQDVSCATCHLPGFGTSDGRTLSAGVNGIGLGPNRGGGTIIPRNSPALFAVHLKSELFWDGRVRDGGGEVALPPAVDISDTMRAVFTPGLEVAAAQAMLPPVSREEMRGTPGQNPLGDLGDGYNSPGGSPEFTEDVWEGLLERLFNTPGYTAMLQDAYPDVELQDFSFAHAANAIAAFEARAFGNVDSPFERFVRGDDMALTREQVLGGLTFFANGCASCHSGSLFTDQGFHNTGMPQLGPGTQFGHNVSPFLVIPGPDLGREVVTGNPQDRFMFRTPSLHNVELTGPWGHAGLFADLRDIQSNVSDPVLVTTLVPISAQVLQTLDPRLDNVFHFDVDEVVEFLGALTSPSARRLSELVPSSVPSGLPIF